MSQEEKIKRRLARKAELARQSRRRKKVYVESLEKKIKELTAKIIELKGRKKENSDSVALALCAMAELQQGGGSENGTESVKSETSTESASMTKLEIGSSSAGSSETHDQHPYNSNGNQGPVVRMEINNMGEKCVISIPTDQLTFANVKEAILAEFHPSKRSSFEVTMWYVDEEGDPIRVTCTPELREAHRLSTIVQPKRRYHGDQNTSLLIMNTSFTCISKSLRANTTTQMPMNGVGRTISSHQLPVQSRKWDYTLSLDHHREVKTPNQEVFLSARPGLGPSLLSSSSASSSSRRRGTETKETTIKTENFTDPRLQVGALVSASKRIRRRGDEIFPGERLSFTTATTSSSRCGMDSPPSMPVEKMSRGNTQEGNALYQIALMAQEEQALAKKRRRVH